MTWSPIAPVPQAHATGRNGFEAGAAGRPGVRCRGAATSFQQGLWGPFATLPRAFDRAPAGRATAYMGRATFFFSFACACR